MFNRNTHFQWATENPHAVRERNNQNRFSVNVWCGVKGSRLFGPFFIEGHLTADKYLEFLNNQLQNYRQVLPAAENENILFQQDGAPPHNARRCTARLAELFGANVISTTGPVRWPARSPDLTPLDFFVWSKIKDKVYFPFAPDNEVELRRRIVEACGELNPAHLLRAVNSVQNRCNLCLAQNGAQFEHLL